MLDNNVSICPYCGRNVIGITEYDYGLKAKGQVVDENMNNQGVSEKIYGSKQNIATIEDQNLKQSINVRYNTAFKKNTAIFISIFFLLSIIAKIYTYKLLFQDNTRLYIFLIPIEYSILLFLSISLKFKVRIKIFIVMLISAIFLGAYWYYDNVLQLNFLDVLLEIQNIAVISVSFIASFLKYKKIKFIILISSSSFILFQYFNHLKSLGLEILDIVFIMKSLLLFIMGAFLILFLLYDFLFFSKK
jgi:hypothetical protein